MPDDARIESLGLAVGTTRIVEEVVLSFTHDRQMDWILPDLPPTGRQVRIPQIAVVGFRDDKVHFEHIWWDQASVLAQLDLLQPMDVPVLRAEEADRIVEFGDPGD